MVSYLRFAIRVAVAFFRLVLEPLDRFIPLLFVPILTNEVDVVRFLGIGTINKDLIPFTISISRVLVTELRINISIFGLDLSVVNVFPFSAKVRNCIISRSRGKQTGSYSHYIPNHF